MDARASRLSGLRDRVEGRAPLPEGAEGVHEAYRAFQRKARTNFAELVVQAVAERMVHSGVRVGDDSSDDDAARAVLKRNKAQLIFPDVYNDMLGLSCGYVSVTGGPGAAKLTYERPEQVITEQDPLDPWETRAGLKIWRDRVAGADYAVLSLPGAMYRWTRQFLTSPYAPSAPIRASGGWQPVDYLTGLVPWVTIVPFFNAGSYDAETQGVAEFERHTDILDRIDLGILQRLVIMAMQAYRQRALKGDLPETDESGNVIDYGPLFQPGAGHLWQLPEGVELWESGTTDLNPLLSAVKDDLRDLSAVTRTPLSTLVPEGANQSADGAAFAREGLIFKTSNRIDRARVPTDQVVARLLAIESGSAELPEVSVDFAPPERLSLSERADAATKAANDLPWRTRVTDIWGYDGDAADRMEAERAQDALVLGLSQPIAPSAPALPQIGQPTPAGVTGA